MLRNLQEKGHQATSESETSSEAKEKGLRRKSPVLSFQSVMIWGAMSSTGVGPLCFLKTNVTASVARPLSEQPGLPLHLSSATG